MPRYKVLELLSTSGADIKPGEFIDIDDDQVAAALLEKNCITPAEVSITKPGKIQSADQPIKEEK